MTRAARQPEKKRALLCASFFSGWLWKQVYAPREVPQNPMFAQHIVSCARKIIRICGIVCSDQAASTLGRRHAFRGDARACLVS
eukprot:5849045-Pleurochrysis_carterae.AAC.1